MNDNERSNVSEAHDGEKGSKNNSAVVSWVMSRVDH